VGARPAPTYEDENKQKEKRKREICLFSFHAGGEKEKRTNAQAFLYVGHGVGGEENTTKKKRKKNKTWGYIDSHLSLPIARVFYRSESWHKGGGEGEKKERGGKERISLRLFNRSTMTKRETGKQTRSIVR